MNNKVILVVLDGLNHDVARTCMGYVNGLVEDNQATLYSLQSELPSLSRPLYECILTGVKPVLSGITHNQVCRLSKEESVFSLARKAGLTTGAAAYHWVSELYNCAPYEPRRDRVTADESLNIQYGMFYQWDHYPDEALFQDADVLLNRYNPDFLLIHPMNIDDAGHKFGLDSRQYRNSARRADMILSEFLPDWIREGYQILITSDHGMNNDQSHGGTLLEEREVPLFVIGQHFSHSQISIQQTEICGLICQLLGIPHDKPYPVEFLR